MTALYRELGFDTLLALAAYMLGVLLDPMLAAAVGFVLVAAGVVTLVPQRGRAAAAVLGFLTVGLAGVGVPRAVDRVVTVPARDELTFTIAASGLVLLLTFALLRLTAFRDRERNAA